MSTRGSSGVGGRARSRTAKATRPNLRQRGIEATRNLRDAMALPTNIGDSTVLGTVLAEVAAEEGRRNQRFAEEVRRRYEEAMATHKPAPSGSRQSKELPPLVPIRRIEGAHKLDPFLPPDPAYLVRLYGRNQLERALQDYTVESLKQTAAQVEQQHPGTKPANRGRRDALMAYILEHAPDE